MASHSHSPTSSTSPSPSPTASPSLFNYSYSSRSLNDAKWNSRKCAVAICDGIRESDDKIRRAGAPKPYCAMHLSQYMRVRHTSIDLDEPTMLTPHQHTSLMALLHRGNHFIKHGRRGEPHRRFFQVKGNELIWSSWTTRSTHIQLNRVLYITRGKQSTVFERSTANDVDANTCLSLHLPDRTVDIECEDMHERDSWLEALREGVKIAQGGGKPPKMSLVELAEWNPTKYKIIRPPDDPIVAQHTKKVNLRRTRSMIDITNPKKSPHSVRRALGIPFMSRNATAPNHHHRNNTHGAVNSNSSNLSSGSSISQSSRTPSPVQRTRTRARSKSLASISVTPYPSHPSIHVPNTIMEHHHQHKIISPASSTVVSPQATPTSSLSTYPSFPSSEAPTPSSSAVTSIMMTTSTVTSTTTAPSTSASPVISLMTKLETQTQLVTPTLPSHITRRLSRDNREHQTRERTASNATSPRERVGSNATSPRERVGSNATRERVGSNATSPRERTGSNATSPRERIGSNATSPIRKSSERTLQQEQLAHTIRKLSSEIEARLAVGTTTTSPTSVSYSHKLIQSLGKIEIPTSTSTPPTARSLRTTRGEIHTDPMPMTLQPQP